MRQVRVSWGSFAPSMWIVHNTAEVHAPDAETECPHRRALHLLGLLGGQLRGTNRGSPNTNQHRRRQKKQRGCTPDLKSASSATENRSSTYYGIASSHRPTWTYGEYSALDVQIRAASSVEHLHIALHKHRARSAPASM